jgi:hypothetical protein
MCCGRLCATTPSKSAISVGSPALACTPWSLCQEGYELVTASCSREVDRS